MTAQAGRKLAAGRKPQRLKAADVDSGCRQRRNAGRIPSAIFEGTVAGAHLRGVYAQVQRVRRAGAPDRVYANYSIVLFRYREGKREVVLDRCAVSA